MPNAPTQTRRTGEQNGPRPAPSSSPQESLGELLETPDVSFDGLPKPDVRQSLGAVSIVCRSVFACLLAVSLGLAAVLAVLLLL